LAIKLDYFSGMVNSINKKYGMELAVGTQGTQIELRSKKGRVFGSDDPTLFESALKSLKKDGTISHYLFEERKDYKAFIESKVKEEGLNPKQAHKQYFESLL